MKSESDKILSMLEEGTITAEEAQELLSLRLLSLAHPTGLNRDGDFEDALCDIDGYHCMIGHDGLLLMVCFDRDSGT